MIVFKWKPSLIFTHKNWTRWPGFEPGTPNQRFGMLPYTTNVVFFCVFLIFYVYYNCFVFSFILWLYFVLNFGRSSRAYPFLVTAWIRAFLLSSPKSGGALHLFRGLAPVAEVREGVHWPSACTTWHIQCQSRWNQPTDVGHRPVSFGNKPGV